MKNVVRFADLAGVFGSISIVIGVWQTSKSAALIVAGVILLLFSGGIALTAIMREREARDRDID